MLFKHRERVFSVARLHIHSVYVWFEEWNGMDGIYTRKICVCVFCSSHIASERTETRNSTAISDHNNMYEVNERIRRQKQNEKKQKREEEKKVTYMCIYAHIYARTEKEMNQERKNKTKETDIYFKRQ